MTFYYQATMVSKGHLSVSYWAPANIGKATVVSKGHFQQGFHQHQPLE